MQRIIITIMDYADDDRGGDIASEEDQQKHKAPLVVGIQRGFFRE